MAWAALRVGLDKDPAVAALVSLTRSAAEWTPLPERHKALLQELLNLARDAVPRAAGVDARPYGKSIGWPPEIAHDKLKDHPPALQAAAVWGDPQKLHAEIWNLKKRQEALYKAIQRIENHLSGPLSPPDNVSEPLELLWWGQSLYSHRLHKSYREIPAQQRVFWMADDMATLGSRWPSEQRVAYFIETLRRIGHALDLSRSLREHATGIIDACRLDENYLDPPEALTAAIDKDPTGLPITLLSMQTRKGAAVETLLNELQSRLGMNLDQQISEAQWATWVCRERLLLRFLDE
ncbi:MAG: GTPase-associated system all-helical protein GASH [Polyangiaceae bacterium]